ncbi:hypothetical protein [Serinicoccus sp. CNJ-927]|uniref:hypothetical protein n=1 Tax=Serinicoccus sp. CNJ-927 TaxID=1904970 RepID=UPI001EDB4A39|nr:hypothetical protein [Serinicoccus sp. CNJ-927]
MECGSAMIGLVDGDPALHAYLSYSDAQVGPRRLEQVGFSVVARQDGDGGAVGRRGADGRQC